MSTVIQIERWPSSTSSLVLLSVAAVTAGCIAAAVGLPSLYFLIVLVILVVFAAIALRQPALTLSAAIWLLGLYPFSWGIQTGVFPKLFGDETLLLLYLTVFPFFYFFRKKAWRPGFGNIYVVLAVFLFTQSISLLPIGHDLVALRNFIETCVLGPLLVVLIVQEVSSADAEKIGTAVVWLTAVIAALSIIERVVSLNPVMMHAVDSTYISSDIVQLTNGTYRPYVSFFHPSEAGTFMGLGVPFALRKIAKDRSILYGFLGLVIAGGLFINATRGVWAGIVAACVLLIPNALLFMGVFVPAGGIAAIAAYVALRDTPFMERLTDLSHLYSRFESWQLAFSIFMDHPFLGVGHMQFAQVYLRYVKDLPDVKDFDILKVNVADNLYLTVLAEHGLIGFLGLGLLSVFVFVAFGKARKRLIAAGRFADASFVHAAQLALVVYAVTGCFADIHLFTKATKFMFILIGLGFAMSSPRGAANVSEAPAR